MYMHSVIFQITMVYIYIYEYIGRDGSRERKKILKSRYKATIVGGQGGCAPLEVEENTIFFTMKMQFQDLLTHKLLGPSINATKIVKV